MHIRCNNFSLFGAYWQDTGQTKLKTASLLWKRQKVGNASSLGKADLSRVSCSEQKSNPAFVTEKNDKANSGPFFVSPLIWSPAAQCWWQLEVAYQDNLQRGFRLDQKNVQPPGQLDVGTYTLNTMHGHFFVWCMFSVSHFCVNISGIFSKSGTVGSMPMSWPSTCCPMFDVQVWSGETDLYRNHCKGRTILSPAFCCVDWVPKFKLKWWQNR